MKYVSPGVYVREIDLSLYVPALSSTIAAFVGTAVKGPVNTKTFISNVDQYIRTFGHPDPQAGTYMTYAALQYLRRGQQLWVVRVAGADATAASTTVKAIKPAMVESSEVATTFDVVADTADTITVTLTDTRHGGNVVRGPVSVKLTAGAARTIDQIVAEIATALAASPLLSDFVTARSLPFTGTTPKITIVSYIADTNVSLTIGGNAATLLGLSTVAVAGTDTSKTFTVNADSFGTWGNNLSVQFTQRKGFKFDIGVYEATPTAKKLPSKGFYGYRVEMHQGAVLDSTGWAEGDDVKGNYIADVLGTATEEGRSAVLQFENPVTNGLPTAQRYIMPQIGTLELTGGTNGGSVTTDELIGVQVHPSTGGPTGLQIFRNPEETDINILVVPMDPAGKEAVYNEVIEICEERADAIAILDTPQGYSVQEVVDWHNGQGIFNDHQAFNSSYAAMYYDWIEIFDAYNAEKVWTPPSGHVAAVYAWTDFIADTWWAPAGFNRGHIVAGLRVGHSPSLGEREFMYGNQNAVNPIVNFPKEGIVIWGQRTLQRKPTALDRVNVRRLMNYMKKVIATAVKYLTFEPNDSITWRQFARLVSPFCETVKAKRGLYDFRVICDETTNPPYQVDNNIMRGVIYLKPTKTAEVIQVDFVLTTTGANFDEVLY